jgi:hypothetical protein
MNVTGTILIDLTDVAEGRQRHRVGALATAPTGAPIEVIVGPLRVTPEAVRLIRQFAEERQLSICVKGESHSVGNWVSALRTGELLGLLL